MNVFAQCSKCKGETPLLPAPPGSVDAAGLTPGQCPHCLATDMDWFLGIEVPVDLVMPT